MFIFVLLLINLATLLYYYATWHFKYWEKLKVFSPRAVPFFGSYPKSATFQQNIIYEQQEYYDTFKDQHRFIGVYERRQPKLLVLDAQLVNDIYVKSYTHFAVNDSSDSFDAELDPIFCKNIFATRHEEWQRTRSVFSPAFTTAKIRPMFPIIQCIGEKMVEYLARDIKGSEGKTFFVKDVTSRFTYDVCMHCIYGLEGNAFEQFSRHGDLVRWFSPSIAKIALKAVLSTFPLFERVYKPSFFPRVLSKWFYETFDAAAAYRKRSHSTQNDFLAFILSSQPDNGYSSADLAAHASMFFFDAFETTSIILAQALYHLANNADAQQTLRNEIADRSPSMARCSADDVQRMSYLDNVINETIRISPSAFLFAKKCTQPIRLADYDGSELLVERGTSVQLPVYAIHHDAQYYERPNEFRPERFDEVSADERRKAGLFLPFGSGPRLCLGRRFAVLQIKVALVHLIRAYGISVSWKTPRPIVASPLDALLTPISDIYLDFTPL